MISHQLCAVRAVESAHRFSFFAREVDMLFTCGDLDVERKKRESNSCLASRQTGWAPPRLWITGFGGSSCMFSPFSKWSIQVSR